MPYSSPMDAFGSGFMLLITAIIAITFLDAMFCFILAIVAFIFSFRTPWLGSIFWGLLLAGIYHLFFMAVFNPVWALKLLF